MPADIDNDADIDRTDLIEEDEDDSAVLEVIRKALEEGADDTAPIGRAFPELEEEGRDEMVTLEKGLELIDKAAVPAQRKPKGDDPDAESPKPGETGAAAKVAEGAETEAQPADGTAQPDAADPYADLLAGIDGERRETLTGRLRQADDMLSIFAGHEAEMAANGITPVQHIRSLAQIDQFARKNPEKYLAWAATEIGKDRAEELISKAAELLGLKVTRDDESDPFEDESVKKLREENRALKAQNRNLGFSPFEAAPPTATDLAAWVEEKAPDGSLKRPLFRDLEAGISRMAQEHRTKTGRPVTFTDLDGFYTALTARLGGQQQPQAAQASAPQAPPAAQAQPAVAGGVQKAAAPGSVDRAKAASKNLDGSGQGASRRPALSADADLDATLRHFMDG